MQRLLLAALCLSLAAGTSACDGGPERAEPSVNGGRSREPLAHSPSPSEHKKGASPHPTPTPTPPPEPPIVYPANRALPDGPGRLAAALERVHISLRKGIAGWLEDGAPSSDPQVRLIELAALFQQRIYRKLVGNPALARAVISDLDGALQRTAQVNFEAGHQLSANLVPVEPPVKLKTSRPAPPQQLLGFYKQAERRFGVAWEVLASVNFVETRFGRILGPSTAGALGPMQFLPSTWERYGAGGDIFDPHDAIMGAARYLRASGALNDVRGALFRYNQSDAYVNAVLAYAGQMRRRPNAFYEYYFWQVFVRTTEGDLQLTGPGADAKP